MYFIYNILIFILMIILSPIIIIALLTTPKFRAGFFQKFGCYKRLVSSNSKTIVIHAVSVGEVIAVEKFVKALRETYKDERLILTTVTKTGNNVAKQKLSNTVDEIIYFPFDIFFAVKSFIHNIKPDIVIIAETEIWPYFSHELKKNNIPLLIINGRISPHSYNGYKKFSWFFKKVLSNYTKILMQTKGDIERIIDIGATKENTHFMGNLKFDITNNLSQDDINRMKTEFKTDNKPVLIVGSTHKSEDEILLNVYKKLIVNTNDLKMILAPRHPERLIDVENLLKNSGFKYGKRSQKDNFDENQIILLDTMGELSKLYAISKVAFIGGSFSSTGGHNPLEAAVFDVPVVSGACVFNFKDIYKYLTDDKAAIITNSEDELYEVLNKLFTNDEFYNISSTACHKVFQENSGAINNVLKCLQDFTLINQVN